MLSSSQLASFASEYCIVATENCFYRMTICITKKATEASNGNICVSFQNSVLFKLISSFDVFFLVLFNKRLFCETRHQYWINTCEFLLICCYREVDNIVRHSVKVILVFLKVSKCRKMNRITRVYL